MSLPESVGKLETLLTSLTKDLSKVHKGNKSAAQRVRVATLKLEKVGKEFRKASLISEKGGSTLKKRKKLRKKKR